MGIKEFVETRVMPSLNKVGYNGTVAMVMREFNVTRFAAIGVIEMVAWTK